MTFNSYGGINLILRHITQKKHLKSIFEDGFLDAEKTLRNFGEDSNYISFELNPESDVLFKLYPKLKSSSLIVNVKDGEQFELLFDGEKMIEDGIEIKKNFGGMSKKELEILIDNPEYNLSREEWESIGKYVFVKKS